MNVYPSDRAVPFGTSDYPEPEPNAAAQAERDRAFNLGIETAAAWHDDRSTKSGMSAFHKFYATMLRRLKREVD
jgi:hypothetical protein